MYSFRTVGPRVRLVVSELGDDGPILGCGWLAQKTLEKHSKNRMGEGNIKTH
jgi:hypothetical protein